MIVRSQRLAAAAAVALLAMTACSGSTPDPASSPTAGATANGDELAVVGTSALKWDPPTLSAEAGEVTITLTAEGAAHDFVIEQLSDQLIVEAAVGETNSATVTLAPGTYTYYCNVTGHRAAGMEGTLTVS